MQERLSSTGCSKCHYHRLSVQWFYNAWIMAILFLHEIHLVQLWEGFGPPGRTIGWRFHFANGSSFFTQITQWGYFLSERVELLRSLNEGICFGAGWVTQITQWGHFFFGAGWVIKITQWGYFFGAGWVTQWGYFFSERIELLRSLNEGIFSERVELLRSLNEGI